MTFLMNYPGASPEVSKNIRFLPLVEMTHYGELSTRAKREILKPEIGYPEVEPRGILSFKLSEGHHYFAF